MLCNSACSGVLLDPQMSGFKSLIANPSHPRLGTAAIRVDSAIRVDRPTRSTDPNRVHLRREVDGRGENVQRANPTKVIGPKSNHAPNPYFWVWISVNGSLPSAPSVSGAGSVEPIGIPHGFAPPPSLPPAPPPVDVPMAASEFGSAVPFGADTGNPPGTPEAPRAGLVACVPPDAWLGRIGNFTRPIAGNKSARQLEAQIRINPVNFIQTFFS